MKLHILACITLSLSIAACDRKPPSTQPSQMSGQRQWQEMAEGYAHNSAVRLQEDPQIAGTRSRTTARYDGIEYDVTMAIGPLAHPTVEKAAVKRYWGWASEPVPEPDGQAPRAPGPHLLDLQISINGQAVFVPPEAYADLIDPRLDWEWGALHKDGPRLLVYINGADAGESYRAKFIVEDGAVVRREVWAGEFPEFGPEVSTYDRHSGVIISVQGPGSVSAATQPTPVVDSDLAALQRLALTGAYDSFPFKPKSLKLPVQAAAGLEHLRKAGRKDHLPYLLEYGLRLHWRNLDKTGLARDLAVADDPALAELIRLTETLQYTSAHEGGWLKAQFDGRFSARGYSSFQIYLWAKECQPLVNDAPNASRLQGLLRLIDTSGANGIGGRGVCHYYCQ